MYFEELELGMKLPGTKMTVTEAHVVLYGSLVGDLHPMHFNELWCQENTPWNADHEDGFDGFQFTIAIGGGRADVTLTVPGEEVYFFLHSPGDLQNSAGKSVFCFYAGNLRVTLRVCTYLYNLLWQYQPAPFLAFKDDCRINCYIILPCLVGLLVAIDGVYAQLVSMILVLIQ